VLRVSLDALGDDCAALLERRLGGANTAAAIQSFLKQVLLVEAPARMEQLQIETQSHHLSKKQTSDFTIEIVGYMKVFSTDYSLLRRGLKVLHSMPRQTTVAKYGADVCFDILDYSNEQHPKLHAYMLLHRSIRRLSFEIMGSLEIKQREELMRLSERLLRFSNKWWFNDNLRSVEALIDLLRSFMNHDTDNSDSTASSRMIDLLYRELQGF
jgi:hypothetical protein